MQTPDFLRLANPVSQQLRGTAHILRQKPGRGRASPGRRWQQGLGRAPLGFGQEEIHVPAPNPSLCQGDLVLQSLWSQLDSSSTSLSFPSLQHRLPALPTQRASRVACYRVCRPSCSLREALAAWGGRCWEWGGQAGPASLAQGWGAKKPAFYFLSATASLWGLENICLSFPPAAQGSLYALHPLAKGLWEPLMKRCFIWGRCQQGSCADTWCSVRRKKL